MAYEKTTWVDNETPITAEKLNNMENGIVEANNKAEVSQDEPTNKAKVWLQKGKKSINLMPNNAKTQTINGVTFTVNSDKSITVNGTSTADIDYTIDGFPAGTNVIWSLKAGTYSLQTGNAQKGIMLNLWDTTSNVIAQANMITKKDFTLSQDTDISGVMLFVIGGYTFNNITIYPMIVEGTEELPYEPYDIPDEIKILNENKEYENFNIGLDTYSKQETVVGIWENGKPIYRKTMRFPIPTTSANGTLTFREYPIADNLDEVISVRGFADLSQYRIFFPLWSDSSGNITRIQINVNKNLQILNYATSTNGYLAIVTVEYTKTTD